MERPENQQQKGQPSARPGEQKDRGDKEGQRTPRQTTEDSGGERQRDRDAE